MNFYDKIVTILGPTAVGKTKFASKLAHYFNGEIISADSRQVYLGMDVGTGKDYDDYKIGDRTVKAHLIDIINPAEEFNLFSFVKHFKSSYQEIINKNKTPFLVGGTGLYLSAVIQNYSLHSVDFHNERAEYLNELKEDKLKSILQSLNPNLHNTTDLIDKKRLIRAILVAEEKSDVFEQSSELSHLIIGLYDERKELKKRIRRRLKQRLETGMIQEVENLVDSGITHEKLRFFGLEYKFLSMYLTDELNYNDMHQKLASSIIKFSKRQMTWFRKMEKEGIEINWLKNNELDSAKKLIQSFLS